MLPVHVIHCAELPERTNACRAHLAERGVAATFWRSVHGASWGVDTRLEFDEGQRISPGHVGLNLGVWALWQHLLLSCPAQTAGANGTPADDDAYVIFEDDVELPHNFPVVLSDLLVRLNYRFRDWDLVFLGLAETEPHVWNKVTERVGNLRDDLCRLHDPFGTHAYIVCRRALPILLDNMAVAQRNLDQQLWERVLKPGLLKWAACVPPIVKQRTFDYASTGKPEWAPSTIDDGIGDKHLNTVVAPRNEIRGPALKATEQDVKRMCGAPVAQVPINDSPELVAATTALIDPLPCIYRGEYLRTPGSTRTGGTVPLTQCGRLNVACYARPGLPSAEMDTTYTGKVTSCEECLLRTSMPSRVNRDKLPLPDGHFNPSMLVYDGKLILATRDSWGHSKVALWTLTNANADWSGAWTAEPIGSFASGHKDAPRLEDPRLFIFRGRLCAQFNLPDGYPPKKVRVGYCRFTENLDGVDHTEVYDSPHGNLYEKNWSPFVTADGLNWIYGTKPKHVVIGEGRAWTTDNPLPWTGGVVRGGASPVLMRHFHKSGRSHPQTPEGIKTLPADGKREDVFYHFFHGCLKRLMGNVYTTGCAVFDAKPPFTILRQTATPLVWPDLPGPGESVVKRFVVWPGGAVPHAGHWHLCLGIDDTFARIVRVPFADVENALTDAPERDSVTSIRETPIATGTHAGGT